MKSDAKLGDRLRYNMSHAILTHCHGISIPGLQAFMDPVVLTFLIVNEELYEDTQYGT